MEAAYVVLLVAVFLVVLVAVFATIGVPNRSVRRRFLTPKEQQKGIRVIPPDEHGRYG